MSLEQIKQLLLDLKAGIGQVVFGQDAVLEQMMIVLVCGGHALLEGVPGTAKTLTVRALARAMQCDTKRIQFTPDLMPSDIIGTNVYNLQLNQFELHQGPIFTDLLLADEINRAPAKTQAALLEAMSESHATIDGKRYELSPVFSVFATQNPIEFEGTYPLPEAQQDRFLLKIQVDCPSEEAELKILEAVSSGNPPDALAPDKLSPMMTPQQLLAARQALHAVRIEPSVMNYLLKIVRSTRDHDSILVGAGPRGSIYLLTSSKARALVSGREYVTPDDVVAMVNPVLAHRMTLTADAEISGSNAQQVLQSILDRIDVPR